MPPVFPLLKWDCDFLCKGVFCCVCAFFAVLGHDFLCQGMSWCAKRLFSCGRRVLLVLGRVLLC